MKTKNKEIILKGKGFIMRPCRKDDFISLVQNANNKKIAKNLQNGFPNPYTKKDSKKTIKNILKSYEKGFVRIFVIDVDGFAAGLIGGSIKMDRTFIFSFGYWLGEKYWGKGIATKAVRLYIKYVFNTFENVKRIEAFTFTWNKSSQRVLEKNGFKFEGTLRKSYLKDGKILDEYMFSKLRNER